MVEIDGIQKEWGDRVGYGKVKARRGRNVQGGQYFRPAPKPKLTPAERLQSVLKKSPEVMVKISGGGKDMLHIKAHLDYISRNGEVALENEQGDSILGKEEVREVRDDWRSSGIRSDNGYRREAFNIVLSMPPGTDREGVKNAAREFARETFNGHQYAFAAHDDEKHPHVHLVVKAQDREGVRLNPRKADLQHWRETFAEKLQEQNIDAAATPRQARGIVQKPEKQVLRHIQTDFRNKKRDKPSRVLTAQHKDIAVEAKGGKTKLNPAQAPIAASRKKVVTAYGVLARTLAAGSQEDRLAAMGIVNLVKNMPPLKTQHESRVEQLSEKLRAVRAEIEKPPVKRRDIER